MILVFFDYKKRFKETDIQYYVFKTSENILNLTAQYLDNNKIVDRDYFKFAYKEFYANLVEFSNKI